MDLSKFQDDTILAEWTLSEAEHKEHADQQFRCPVWRYFSTC